MIHRRPDLRAFAISDGPSSIRPGEIEFPERRIRCKGEQIFVKEGFLAVAHNLLRSLT